MQIPGVRSYEELETAEKPKLQDKALGKSAFLELMITQIRNQDPLDPAKNEDFVAQLAQFSSLEGIQNMNQSMDAMATAFWTSMTLDSAAMVGRSVLVPTDTVLMDQDQLGFFRVYRTFRSIRKTSCGHNQRGRRGCADHRSWSTRGRHHSIWLGWQEYRRTGNAPRDLTSPGLQQQ